MIKLIKNIFKKEENEESILDSNIKRFEYIANSLVKKQIEIIESNDDIGGYYNNKLILPKKIKTHEKEKNIKCFIYRIIFSIFSKKLNFYLPENKKDLNYLFLSSLITVKKINKKIRKNFLSFKNLIKEINSSEYNITNNDKNFFFLHIKKKLMYKRNKKKYKLEKEKKYIIYKIENIKHIQKKEFKKNIEELHKNIIKIFNKNEEIDLNPLWGYLYYNEDKKEIKNIKKIIKKINNNKKNKENIIKKNIIKKKQKKYNKNEINNLNNLFDYKKTIDKYKKGEKKKEESKDFINDNVLKELELNNYSNENEHSKSITKNIILNEVKILKLDDANIKLKKYTYKEWDFKIKKYKKNWCSVFLKKEETLKTEDKIYINEIKKKYKNEIKKIKEKIEKIKNNKIWKKMQTQGDDIDLDTIIDNYKDIKNGYFYKYHKYKKKKNENIKITILFDSSSSTESYINENYKIINFIKEIIIILNECIKNIIQQYSIATFYSNTRHDCTYKIIKNFKKKNKISIKNLTPNGYTRIGPSIRHAIKESEKIKNKKNIIILITDGNPTDYDEYEGMYGIHDIKKILSEVKKKNIIIKTIIINNNKNQNFIKIFEKNDLKIINDKKNISIKIINLFKDLIKN